jgi:hypothetical protein
MLTEMHRRRCVGRTALGRSEHQATRLQDPDLVLEAYRECRIHRKDGEEAGLSEQGQKLATQIKLANTEMRIEPIPSQSAITA